MPHQKTTIAFEKPPVVLDYDRGMMKESLLSDRTAKCLTVILYLAVGAVVLYMIGGVHGDGWVKPTIRVQVKDPRGSLVEEATVIFFDRESQRDYWLHLREESLSSDDCLPDRSIGATNSHGQAEVQGSFGAAFYLYHTYLGGRGILRVEKPGYTSTEIVIDSRERRREILNELIELNVTLKQANAEALTE